MKPMVVVRGAGDLATGVIHRLHRSGFPVVALEVANPSVIRRRVAFGEAAVLGKSEVEGVICRRAERVEDVQEILRAGEVPLLIDPEGRSIPSLHPEILIDAILAKVNLGTHRKMAPFTIALGPGFRAGVDADCVIETKRGHRLGRILYEGEAIKNTGVPGVIAGFGRERVMHAEAEGTLHLLHDIGDVVEKGEVLAWIVDKEHAERHPLKASLTGVLRGILREGYPVTMGLKAADIDPRLEERQNCTTISDKARCISGGVLEAVMHYLQERDLF